MTVAEIRNPKAKQIVKYALAKGDYKVTVAHMNNEVGFRIKKSKMLGWDIINELIIKSGLSSSNSIYATSGLNFSVFEDSIIVWND